MSPKSATPAAAPAAPAKVTRPPKTAQRADPFASASAVDAALGVAPAFVSAQPAAAQPGAAQQDAAQGVAAHSNVTQGAAAPAAVPHVAPTHGKKVRVTAYVAPEDAAAILALAGAEDRSDSYIAGKLIAEALAARRAAATV